MKKWRLAAVSALIAVLVICLFLALFPSGASSANALELWYISGDCSDKALEAAVASYNRRTGKQARSIKLQCFEDEAALGAAFETDMPDLLLCSHAKAVQLNSRAVLAKLETATDIYTQDVSGLEGVGEYFFPLGASVTVLITDSAKCKTAKEEQTVLQIFIHNDSLILRRAPRTAPDCRRATLEQSATRRGTENRGVGVQIVK